MNKIAFVAAVAKIVAGLALVGLALVGPAPHGSTFEPSAPLDPAQARVVVPPPHDQRTLQCYWRGDDPAAGVDCVEAGSVSTEDDE